jgi:hypothetical protein
MKKYVVDASVLLKWVLGDEREADQSSAMKLLNAWVRGDANLRRHRYGFTKPATSWVVCSTKTPKKNGASSGIGNTKRGMHPGDLQHDFLMDERK